MKIKELIQLTLLNEEIENNSIGIEYFFDKIKILQNKKNELDYKEVKMEEGTLFEFCKQLIFIFEPDIKLDENEFKNEVNISYKNSLRIYLSKILKNKDILQILKLCVHDLIISILNIFKNELLKEKSDIR
jgi:hypothetical protein